MDGTISFRSRPGNLAGVTRFSSLVIAACAVTGLAFGALLGGCSSTEAVAVGAKVKVIGTAVQQDASSLAGQKILADVTSTSLNVGLDVASGNDVGAIVAGIQGAASALRDYEGLPVAPASATIARAAADGSGVAVVAQTITPAITSIITSAQSQAQAQHVALSTDQITEAVARGLDAVANAKTGEAP